MKIFRQGSINPFEAYQKQQAQLKKVDTQDNRDPAISKGDILELSSDIKRIENYAKKIKDLPEIREGLVKEIKEQMKAGTYYIPPEKIAENLLNLMGK
ncbi:MAG: flagellar biosynthesis anti-sigma factor FlgM [Bacillota bacterium]